MIAALAIYHLAMSVVAGMVAWSLTPLAALLGWPRRGIWIASLLCSLLAPALLLGTDERRLPTAVELPAEIAREVPPTVPRLLPEPTDFGRTASPSTPESTQPQLRVPTLRLPQYPAWDPVLLGLWIAASFGMACVLVGSALRAARQLLSLPSEIIDGVTVLVSTQPAHDLGPAVFGWLRPRIVVPRWVLESQQHRTLVLMHEQAHAKAYDPLLFGLGLALVVLAPWNPLLWWQLRQLRFAVEVDCDARVLQQGADLASYGETLLHVAQHSGRTSLTATALTEPTSQLGKRVHIMTMELSMLTRVRLMATSLGVLGVSAVIAAQVEPPSTAQPTPTEDAARTLEREAGRVVRQALGQPATSLFLGGGTRIGPASIPEQEAALRAALSDPEQRRALRVQKRPQVEQYNPKLAEALGLDDEMEDQLLDLLADQQLDAQLRGLANLSAGFVAGPGNSFAIRPVPETSQTLQSAADTYTSERGTIKTLLGEARFGRYLDYQQSIRGRLRVAEFEAGLGADRLSTQQREALVEIYMAEYRLEQERSTRTALTTRPSTDPPNAPQQRTRGMSAETISMIRDGRERYAQDLSERRARLLQSAAPVLSATQLAALERRETALIDAERAQAQGLQQALDKYANATGSQPRSSARTADEQPPAKLPLTGQLSWFISVAVNSNTPVEIGFVNKFGEEVDLPVGDGLVFVATPIAYDVQRFSVQLKIYELDSSGTKRFVAAASELVDFSANASVSAQRPVRNRRNVWAGSKGYVVEYGITGALQ